MAIEKTGFNLKITLGSKQFCAKGKKLPTYTADEKIDITTDCLAVPIREFLAGDLYTIEDLEVTTPLDMKLADDLRQLINQPDTLIIGSTYTSSTLTIENAWISKVDMGSADIGSGAEMTIAISFGGGAAGEPTLTV
jgi:hypothetical protein